MDEKILKKITNLLAMADGQANENESEIALSKAYNLMQEYGLSREDVANMNKDAVLGELDEQRLVRTPMVVWEQKLLCTIAHLFDCEVLRDELKSRYVAEIKYSIIGREGNRTTVKVMYDWLRHKIDRDKYHIPARARMGYCVGVVDEIGIKARALKQDNANKTDAWGIVPMDEVAVWLANKYGKLGSHKNTSSLSDWSAYDQGRADGRTVSLNKQMQTTALPCAV